MQAIVLAACGLAFLLFILSQFFKEGDSIPAGTPLVVLVTVLDVDNYSKEYINNIMSNRQEYAKKHGKYSAR